MSRWEPSSWPFHHHVTGIRLSRWLHTLCILLCLLRSSLSKQTWTTPQQWCQTMCHGWSSIFIPASESASCTSQRWRFNQQNHLVQALDEKAADSWPFNALVCPLRHMMSKILCNYSETTKYTAIKTASQASVCRQETLTPQPGCQVMCANNYSKKSVTDPFGIRQSGTPVESKPDTCNQARAAQDNTTAFSQQMTPLGQSRRSFHHSSIPVSPVSFRPGW